MRTLSKPWRAPCGCTATVILAMGERGAPVSSRVAGIVACIRHARAADTFVAALRDRQDGGADGDYDG